jgi:hypothetical protein
MAPSFLGGYSYVFIRLTYQLAEVNMPFPRENREQGYLPEETPYFLRLVNMHPALYPTALEACCGYQHSCKEGI